MDATTHNILSYAGVRCRVLGTFYVIPTDSSESQEHALAFGADLSNYYPNKGLKVFKPRAAVLDRIVNYRDPVAYADRADSAVGIGRVRYASTNRPYQQVNQVSVSIVPRDLLGQKTALFGMTRTGKSNTTKIMLKAIFELRWRADATAVGQLVFDPNGEYANENTQDANDKEIPTAVKNVWACGPKGRQEELKDQVVTYGITPHPNDPKRNLMLLNFFTDENLEIGKSIIDSALTGERGSKYISNFCDVRFEPPAPTDRSATTRHRRRVLAYRALLCKAGLTPPPGLKANTQNLFGTKLRAALNSSEGDRAADYKSCATILGKTNPGWAELQQALQTLRTFINGGASEWSKFDTEYVKTSSSGSWADDDFRKLLEMFAYANGSRLVGRVKNQHTATTSHRLC